MMTSRGKREDAVFAVGFLLIVVILFTAAVLAIPKIQAAGVTFSASTTVSITDPAETWTIAGGSNASSVQVAVSSTIIALQNTDSITFSVTNRNFSATGQSSDSILARTTCYTNQGDGVGKIVITATQNETVTLWTTACGLFVQSRAGQPQQLPTYGGRVVPEESSPPPSPTPPATPTPPPEFSVLPAKPTITQIQLAINEVLQKITALQANPTVPDILSQLQRLVVRIALIQQVVTGVQAAPTGGGAITQTLRVGLSGSQVTALQNFLKSQGTDIYPEGLVTGYFGPLTREAVERFQEKYGIANEGDQGYGFVGPKTRAQINSLLGQ